MTDAGVTTRDRILDAALELTALKGPEGTSMRELANACGVNVAALYYHFPSKADLLRAVIEERHYDLMMGLVEVPPVGTGSDRERLHELMCVVWEGIQGEERIWRLRLAESCHHTTDAQEVAATLVTRFEEVAAHWLAEEFGDFAVPVPIAARLVADLLFASIARVAIGSVTDDDVIARASDLAGVIVAES